MQEDFHYLNALAKEPNGNVTYLPLCDGSMSVPQSPRFIFGACSNDVMMRYFSESRIGQVGLYTASNIDLFGIATLLRGEAIVLCDEIQMDYGSLSHYATEYRAASSSVRTKIVNGRCVLFCGPGYIRYGHWLVDFLPKLFVLNAAGFNILNLQYLVPQDTPAFGLEIMDALGITADKRVIYDQKFDRVRAEELLIPTMVRTNSRTSPLFRSAARFVSSLIRQRHVNSFSRGNGQRIFVSRRGARDLRRLLNRERIEQLAEEAGFTIVHPERIPLVEQFAMFDNARQIIGEYGSALHASIFSDADTVVCAIRGNGSPVAGFLQSAIGESLNQPTGYVFGSTIIGDPSEYFTVPEDALQICLHLIFGQTPLA